MNAEQYRELDEEGFLLLKHVLSSDEVNALIHRLEELWIEEGTDAGKENYMEVGVRRLANLANKGDIFRPIFANPLALEAVRVVVGPQVHVSMLNARDALPSSPNQPLHVDTDKSGKPDAKGYYVCTCLWMLDDFTNQNGATRLIPGTHRSHQLPKEVLTDLYAPHPEEVIVEGQAGDVLVFNGHCWHAGRANLTQRPRRAILAHYIRGDHPQRLNQKEALSPETWARMTAQEQEILG